jgi:hypothetical protein
MYQIEWNEYQRERRMRNAGFSKEFEDVLEILKGNFRPTYAEPSVLFKVPIAEVTAFALRSGWSIPEEMKAFAGPSAPEVPQEHIAKRVPVTIAETRKQREDRRLIACETAGLVMPISAAGRLPDGVGKIAESEGVKRQPFSADVKAAIKRREIFKKEGQ